MRKYAEAEILSNKPIAPGIFDMSARFPEDLSDARAGQFAMIYMRNEKNLLPRPISVCDFDSENHWLRFIYKVVGEGTGSLSELRAGDRARVLAPLGNGFNVTANRKHVAIVGGGVGVPPLLGLAKAVRAKNPGARITVVLGFATKDAFLVNDFASIPGVDVNITTDDGSLGYHGNTVGFMRDSGLDCDTVYACGPRIMLKFLAELCAEKDMACFVSMEERMGCGLGACVGCVVLVRPRGEGQNFYKKVCKDGPVFNAREVVW